MNHELPAFFFIIWPGTECVSYFVGLWLEFLPSLYSNIFHLTPFQDYLFTIVEYCSDNRYLDLNY